MTVPEIDFEAIAELSECPRFAGPPPLVRAVLKHEPEDFVVEELPVYQPSGEGEHLFLWIEKRDMTAESLRGHVARQLEIPRDAIGIAGNKDKRAVTRQFISVPAAAEQRIETIVTPAVRVLDAKRHSNKLRSGHLCGNRFEILLRDVAAAIPGADMSQRCSERLRFLAANGFANYFGPQRFGAGDTARLGWELLTGALSRKSARLGRSMFRLALSAAQSAIFNQVVARRVQQGNANRVLAGDVVMFRTSRTHFRTEDAAVEQERVDGGELVLTGPMFGRKMTAPADEPAEIEVGALAAFGLCPDDFQRYPKLTSGTRRPLLQWPTDLQWEFEASGLRLTFELPAGTYATVLLRELVDDLQTAPFAGGTVAGG